MSDCSHQFGGDLAVSATGDLLLASGDTYVRQRILRRLLTNSGDYIWHLAYGAGLRRQVGQDTALLTIQQVVRSQIFAETDVAQTPAPIVSATRDSTGNVTVSIVYADATTATIQQLSFQV